MLTSVQSSLARVLFVTGLITSAPGAMAAPPPSQPAEPSAANNAQVVQNYGKLPLSFEANQGQLDKSVKFLSRGSGYSLFLTDSAAVLSLTRSAG